MKIKIKKQNLTSGITLIALVVTIVVLLILAGVTIATLTGDNGIITQAQNAKKLTNIAEVKEMIEVETLGSYDKKGKLSVEKVISNIETNIKGSKVDYIGKEGEFSLRVTVEGNEFIIDEDGTVRRPVTNPYDTDGWTYAWVCEDGNWKGKNETGDEPYTIEDLETVKAVESRDGIVAKFYQQKDKVTPESELTGTLPQNNAYHLVIEGIGEIGILINESETIVNAWLMQLLLSFENSNVNPILPYITEAYICDGITNIGMACFGFAASINKVLIGDTVTSLDYSAFAHSSITNITIPSSVAIIGDNVFNGCNSLEKITIPNNVTSIGDSAFYECSSLAKITIPSRVTSMGDSAFYKCSSLTEITIPSSVTSIGDYALSSCSSLTSITYEGMKE